MQEQVLYPLEAEVTMVTSFQDADPMGVIYHGNFFRYFEEARRVLMEKIQYGYRDMQDSGYMCRSSTRALNTSRRFRLITPFVLPRNSLSGKTAYVWIT